MFNRRSSLLVTAFSLLIVFAGWMLLAPTQLGGWVTYVIVDGNSMEPGFHRGDLLLVRTESGYGVGDAVAYQNKELGKFVFHRIVGTESDRFILKGDNNSWLDSYYPNQDEVVGKLWIHIPKLGRAIEWVRLPIHFAMTAALLGGVLMSGMIAKPTRGGNDKTKSPRSFFGRDEIFLALAGFLALIFLGLSIFSFTRPLTRSTGSVPYQQEGRFIYSATGTPGVYDTELVRPGEPVFPKLTCFLNIGFTYNLIADQLQGASGTYLLYARALDEQSGWQRTIPLTPQTTFSGNAFFSAATLDLCQVESLANLVEQETGLHPNTYTLEIISHLELTGTVAGSQINDTFDPTLVFKFDKTHFYLDLENSQTDPLHSVKQGSAGGSVSQENTFSILGLQPTVWSVRMLSLLGLAFSLAGLAFAGVTIYDTARQSEVALIKLKYGSMLVDVYKQNLVPTSTIIDLASIDDLAKLAERQGTMILHMTLNFLHYYLVQINGTTYRYVVSAGKKGIVADDSNYDEAPIAAVRAAENHAPPAKPVFQKTPRHWKTTNRKNSGRIKPVQGETPAPPAHRRKEEFTEWTPSVPMEEDGLEYVINSGEIEFVLPQPKMKYFEEA